MSHLQWFNIIVNIKNDGSISYVQKKKKNFPHASHEGNGLNEGNHFFPSPFP
jgi:hypothetical protein